MKPEAHPDYQAWKQQVSDLPAAEAEFERWLFVRIASVLFGEKAGELLVIRTDQSSLGRVQRLRRIADLSRSWNLSCLLLSCGRLGLKVIVYDRRRTRAVLGRVPDRILTRMGYQAGIGARCFLGEIKKRWENSGNIPHEIGLALGYPLKDVLGFMGLYPLRYAGGCGWRIYGNPTLSMQQSQRFKRAREMAITFLEHN